MTNHLGRSDEHEEEDLGGSLVDSLLSREVTNGAASLTDVILSQLTSEDVLGRVPVFGAIFNLYKGYVTIQDHLNLKKIAYFLSGCEKKDFEEMICPCD